MTIRSFLLSAVLGFLHSSALADTVITVLHPQVNPSVLAILQEAAKRYESANPGVKVQFFQLANKSFKAESPTPSQIQPAP